MANSHQQKILPRKPHFFNVLIDDFHKSIDIPAAFYHKYLEGRRKNKYEEAELRSIQGKTWTVKLVGNRITGKGWTKFYRDHDLRIGNFLVFRHEGNMVFDAMVFEPSACEKRDYNFPIKNEDATMDEGDENDPMEDDADEEIIKMRASKEFKGKDHNGASKEGSGTKLMDTPNAESKLFEQKSNENIEDDSEDNEVTVGGASDLEAKKHHRRKVNSGDEASPGAKRHRYVGRVKPYEIRSTTYFLPKEFTRDSILNCKECHQIMIRDEEDRLWQIELGRTVSRNQVFMKAKCWEGLRVGNNLNVGDGFALELIEQGRIPLLSFQKLQGDNHVIKEATGTNLKDIPNVGFKSFKQESDKDNEDESEDNEIIMGAPKSILLEAKKHYRHNVNSDDNGANHGTSPHRYVSRLKPYELHKAAFLPKRFTKDNVLNSQGCKQIIIRDQEGRKWPVHLGRTRNNQVFMKKRDWQDLRVGNNLNEGDGFVLELIQEGSKPLLSLQTERESGNQGRKCHF